MNRKENDLNISEPNLRDYVPYESSGVYHVIYKAVQANSLGPQDWCLPVLTAGRWTRSFRPMAWPCLKFSDAPKSLE